MMMNRTNNLSWLEQLPEERDRLVRLCARLSGSYQAAEDLAQETLLEAWRQAGNLRDPSAWRGFVTGIARNICLRWRRERGKELVFRAPDNERHGLDAYAVLLDTAAAAPVDLEASLERAEMADLLDKAMAELPDGARDLLVERYVEDLSPNEMAERRGLTDNTLGVRLHRARVTLQRLLATPSFREMAASYGLISTDSAEGWQETRIWCPRCGRNRLEGRFITPEGTDSLEAAEQGTSFAVRCPECERALGIDFSSRHPGLPLEEVLGSVRGFKPALNRLSLWWNDYYTRGLTRGKISCPVCSHQASVTTTPPIGTHPALVAVRGAYIHCQRCGPPICVSPSGIAYHSAAVQRFWKDHPRMALTEERDLRYKNEDAVAVVFRSLADNASLEVVLSRNSFETLTVSNGKNRTRQEEEDSSSS
ncbi:MAG: hypothetical protein OHK0029_33780 [Armatimonadaceae bacterium]